MDEKLTELIRKVKALAERGIDGEQENARRVLEALMKKHNLTFDDLISNETKTCQFKVPKGAKNLFVNIVCEVLVSHRVRMWKWSKGFACDLTPTQEADVRAMLKHYLDIYNRESKKLRLQLKLVATAINSRFDIAGNVPEDPNAKPSSLSVDEIAALAKLMAFTAGTKFVKKAGFLEDSKA